MSNNPTPFEREKISPHLKKGKRKKTKKMDVDREEVGNFNNSLLRK